MYKALAINSSPRMGRGNTGLVLNTFLEGFTEGGSSAELIYSELLKIKPCSCGRLYCWNEKPGFCIYQDEMQPLYAKIKACDMLIFATPVYIPIPGSLQNLLNRMCALLDPVLERRNGRTRAKLRKDVSFNKIVLVATSGWWELGNFDTVLRIMQELAEDASVEFTGAVLRPHASFLKSKGELTPNGKLVLEAVKDAGYQLGTIGRMDPKTLHFISQPLISEEAFYQNE